MKLYSFGKGAQELYVIDTCEALDIEYCGALSRVADYDMDAVVFPLGSTPEAKRNLIAQMQAARVEPYTLIHPTVQVSQSAFIDKGVMINPFVCIAAKAVIKTGAVIHAHTVVGHDNEVGSFCNISPGCLLTGGVTVGHSAVIGTGAVVCPNVHIGSQATVWAGAVIQKDVAPQSTFYVLPAKQPFGKGA